jgi:uncharacterized RDD family membrane protein YckC
MNAETQQNPYAPPRAKVSDIGGEVTVEPASRGIRLGAAILDIVIFTIAYLPLMISISSNPMAIMDPATFMSAMGLLTIAAYLVLIGITIVFVHRNGQTIGKKLVGIKVVRSDGSRASLGRIFWLRNFVNGLPSLVPILGGVYVLVDHLFIFGDKRQCVHDKIADTIVVTA